MWKPSPLRSNWFRATKGFNVCVCVCVRNRQTWLNEMLFGEWRSESTWQVRRRLLQAGRDMMVALTCMGRMATQRNGWIQWIFKKQMNVTWWLIKYGGGERLRTTPRDICGFFFFFLLLPTNAFDLLPSAHYFSISLILHSVSDSPLHLLAQFSLWASFGFHCCRCLTLNRELWKFSQETLIGWGTHHHSFLSRTATARPLACCGSLTYGLAGWPFLMAWGCCNGITELGVGACNTGERWEFLFLQGLWESQFPSEGGCEPLELGVPYEYRRALEREDILKSVNFLFH